MRGFRLQSRPEKSATTAKGTLPSFATVKAGTALGLPLAETGSASCCEMYCWRSKTESPKIAYDSLFWYGGQGLGPSTTGLYHETLAIFLTCKERIFRLWQGPGLENAVEGLGFRRFQGLISAPRERPCFTSHSAGSQTKMRATMLLSFLYEPLSKILNTCVY